VSHTNWHITFGTYGTRLHGEDRPTVNRRQNDLGQIFVEPNERWVAEDRTLMKRTPVWLSHEQRVFVEESVPELCLRGCWVHKVCAAAANHVHVVLSAEETIHGKQVRSLLKRWLGQALSSRWSRRSGSDGSVGWAEGGSNIALRDRRYYEKACLYVSRQSTFELDRLLRRGEDAPARGWCASLHDARVEIDDQTTDASS
jgi:REP element-mobilizing transposase RayT